MVKIILNMIVKNESRIIQRVMKSAFQIADAFSICDTGSTDNTIEKITEFATENGVSGYVYNTTWVNFGHNRSESFLKCRETCDKLGWNREDTYALLLDGDHIFMIDPGFDKNSLTLAGYQIPQKEHNIRYHNTRFIKLSRDWNCVGVTHEYWNMENLSQNLGRLDNPWIDDHADGGCKEDKFERDIKLLTKGLEDEPENERYMFYLGQSYKDNKQYEESIHWFKKRIEMKGWTEEVFYSMLQIGRIYAHYQDTGKCMEWYLKAYNEHPIRNEPLVELAHYLGLSGDHTSAIMFAKKALEIPFPQHDLLFVAYNFYHEVPNHLILDMSTKPKNNILDGIKSANNILLSQRNIGEDVLKYAKKFTNNIMIRIQVPSVRVMEPKTPEVIYTGMRIKGKMGFGMREDEPVSIRDMSSPTSFSYTPIKDMKKPGLSILEFEKYGKTGLAKVIHNGKTEGGIFTFGPGDILEKCNLINISQNTFSPFFVDGKVAIIRSISPMGITILGSDNTILNNLEIKIPYNLDGMEDASSVYEHNGMLYFSVRWKNEGNTLHRLIRMEKNFQKVEVSLPISLSGSPNDRITSFFFEGDEIVFYYDSDGVDSSVMRAPMELLAKIY